MIEAVTPIETQSRNVHPLGLALDGVYRVAELAKVLNIHVSQLREYITPENSRVIAGRQYIHFRSLWGALPCHIEDLPKALPFCKARAQPIAELLDETVLPPAVSLDEARRLLGIGRQQLMKLVRHGSVNIAMIGGRTAYCTASMRIWARTFVERTAAKARHREERNKLVSQLVAEGLLIETDIEPAAAVQIG